VSSCAAAARPEALDLTEAHIAALTPALRNSPLDVIVVTNWLKGRKPEQRAPLLASLIEGIDRETDAATQSEDEDGAELVALRITGILTPAHDRAHQRQGRAKARRARARRAHDHTGNHP
jgi:hypothetical protein